MRDSEYIELVFKRSTENDISDTLEEVWAAKETTEEQKRNITRIIQDALDEGKTPVILYCANDGYMYAGTQEWIRAHPEYVTVTMSFTEDELYEFLIAIGGKPPIHYNRRRRIVYESRSLTRGKIVVDFSEFVARSSLQ